MKLAHRNNALLVLSALGLAAVLPQAAQAQTTVYSNGFTSGSTAGWNVNTVSTTPGTASHPADNFLGQLGDQTATLTLNGLATHTDVTLTFSLYMIRSMDGNGPDGGGPDPWGLNENGSSLIQTNFANYTLDNNDTQDFGGSNGAGGYLTGGHYAPYTGSAEQNTLGYTFNGVPMDSVYDFSFTFADASPTLALNFVGQPNESLDNESWGLDNVQVTTNAAGSVAPEPSPVAAFAFVGLGAAGLILRARKRKAVPGDGAA